MPERDATVPPGDALKNTGAVIAVLLGVPSFFVGLFGAAGVVTGQKIVAGILGAAWGYMAVVGAWELNRRRFDFDRGRRYADQHLLAGSIAVASGLAISGALHETMPILAVIPALSAIRQAGDGHADRRLCFVHGGILLAGLGIGIWFYVDGIIGKVLLDRIGALP